MITLYEELSMNAHPALMTRLYDGWVLRFAKGYTNRANSVNPIYPSRLPMVEKIGECEDLYADEGLPTVFKLTKASPAGLDEVLEERGYERVTPTSVFTKGTLSENLPVDNVILSNGLPLSWREECFRLNGLTDEGRRTTASSMMDHIKGNALSAKILHGEKAVACGLCVLERGYAGLFDIAVDPNYRRRGYGFALCGALLAGASRMGARGAYLQVVDKNVPAIALYKNLGFQPCYPYWYRVKPMAGCEASRI